MRSLCCTLVVALLLGCAGGDLKPKSKTGEAKLGQKTGPQIVIGPRLEQSGIAFGKWEPDFIHLRTTMEMPANSPGIGRNSITVKCQGRDGVKHQDGHSDHPALAAGQKGQIKIFAAGIHKDVSVVTLDLPD